MIFAEDNLFLFLQYGGRGPIRQPAGRPVFRQKVAGGRNMWVNETTRKRTKAEAKDRLPHLPTSVRRQIRKKPVPSPIMIPFYALELADILIEIDPLDRLED
jgi:hypothetical protein